MAYIRVVSEDAAAGDLAREYEKARRRAFAYLNRVADGLGVDPEPDW